MPSLCGILLSKMFQNKYERPRPTLKSYNRYVQATSDNIYANHNMLLPEYESSRPGLKTFDSYYASHIHASEYLPTEHANILN